MKDIRHEAVILGDGDFPSSPEALAVLANAKYLCCCDNAGKRLIEQIEEGRGLECRFPDAIVGDGDSLPEEFKKRYADIYHQIDEQEYNDLTKATRYCISQGFRDICYLGCTGKREDHTLGNISLMAFYQRQFGIKPTMVSDYGIFTVHNGSSKIETFPRQQVSIFNLSCKTLTSQGLKWDAYPYHELWQGTLNEALADTVTFDADGEYIVYRTHLPKL